MVRVGGTNFIEAFKVAIQIITNEFQGRANKRIIIFMTDGDGTYDRTQVQSLKNTYGVDSFYAIAYRGGSQDLKDMVNIFAPNSALLESNSSNLTDTFKNILYQINASTPETIETIDGRLDISDMRVSQEQPLTVTVTRNGNLIKTIKITQYPTSSEGVIIIYNGNMYLSIEGLMQECDLTDLQDIEISIEYFAGE